MDSDLLQKLGTVLTAALEQRPDRAAMMSLAGGRYVTIALASVMTGLSEKAIRRKIEYGVWRERIEWRRAPDGHLMVDIQGVERWVEATGTGQRQVAPRTSCFLSPLASIRRRSNFKGRAAIVARETATFSAALPKLLTSDSTASTVAVAGARTTYLHRLGALNNRPFEPTWSLHRSSEGFH